MDGDVWYAVLMGFGWLFLAGWVALLLIACRLAFRSEQEAGSSSSQPHFASGTERTVSATGRWNIHLRG